MSDMMMMGAGNRSASGYTFTDSDAAAYDAALTGALTDSQKSDLDTLVLALKAIDSGNVWADFELIHLYDIPTNATDSLLNLKTAASKGALVNTPSWAASQGWTFNGSDNAIDLQISPADMAGNGHSWNTGNAGCGAWVRTFNSSTDDVYIGVDQTSTYRCWVGSNGSSNTHGRSGHTTSLITGTTRAVGLSISQRTGATAHELYVNTSTAGTSTDNTASDTSGDQHFHVGAKNDRGTLENYADHEISIAFLGGALTTTERDAVHSAFSAWRTAREAD